MNKLDMLTEGFKTKYDHFITGCDAIEDTGAWDVEKLGEMDVFYVNDLISIIIRIIAADGNISQKEVEYLNKNFGFEYTVEELTFAYDECKDEISNSFDESFDNGISYMRKINSKLADAYKDLLMHICQIIIESDDIITPAETAEVRKLQEMCN